MILLIFCMAIATDLLFNQGRTLDKLGDAITKQFKR